MEAAIKLYVWRIKFFNKGWNILDLIIVVFNLVDFVLPMIFQGGATFNGAAVFRLLRVFRSIRAFRVMRTLRFMGNLQVIVATILQSVKSIGAIIALMSLVWYIFAVIGRDLYASVDETHFGNIYLAFFTLFQLLTLDDWFEIFNKAVLKDPGNATIIFYLIAYIIVEYFIFLNLFVAVLVDNFQLTLEAQQREKSRMKKSLEDSDDEDDYRAASIHSGSTSSLSEEAKRNARKTVKEYYPSAKPMNQELLHRYFLLLTALEYNQHHLSSQHRVIDLMVDISADVQTHSKMMS